MFIIFPKYLYFFVRLAGKLIVVNPTLYNVEISQQRMYLIVFK